MVVLQWNMGTFKEGEYPVVEARRTKFLVRLLDLYKPDLVALQEAPRGIVERELLNAGYSFSTPKPKQRMVTGWKNMVWGAPLPDPISYRRVSAVLLPMLTPDGISREVLVCNVHLPSLAKNGSGKKTKLSLEELIIELQAYRTRTGAGNEKAEIILGDFNLEPHTLRLQKKTGLYGNRSLDFVADREKRWLKGERYRPLYNPTWRLYGAEVAPHGTHYYTGEPDEPWYVFDQAFFSSNLSCQPAQLKLVTDIDGQSLLSRDVFQPDVEVGSDHLPLIWTIIPQSK